jgi:4-carboxymuconolactone decarboxylase
MRTLRLILAGASILLICGGAAAQQLAADLNADTGARLPYTTRGAVGEAGARVADIFARGGPETPVSGPLAWAAYNPFVATALLDLHDGAMGQGSLEPNIRELAVLVACRATNYTFEWNAHVRGAPDVGITDAAIAIVHDGKAVAGLSDEEATVIRFGRELLDDRNVSPETFAKAVDLFGERGAMDLVAVMMTYAVSGFYAIAVDEHPPGQAPLEPLR